MKALRQFDTSAAAIIARLPKSLHRPFDILGYAMPPSTWALALAAYSLAAYDGSLLAPGVFALFFVPGATISKFLFKRHRPPTIYAGNMRIKSYSFPSSHAYSAALGAGFFASAAFASQLVLLGWALICLAFVIGVSRVFLGAHYPSDVIGGWLLGGLVVAGILLWA